MRDGWVSIHCNFPNRRDAALRVLDTRPDREDCEKASAAWKGEALEDAIHAAGGCAGFVRSREEWSHHPHAKTVAGQPLLEIVRIGDAPPQPMPAAQRPLAGVRVLDLTLPDSGVIELDSGIGKRSRPIDLRGAGGVATLEALARLRPGMVCVSLSAWGPQGPWRERRGFDSIVQAVSGMAQASGDGARPRLLPVSAIDHVSGYLMAFGATLALARRAREGGSWAVRVALARVGKWIVDLGEAASSRSLPEDLPEAELRRLFGEMDAPDGRIRYLLPVLRLSETPPHWSRPPVPLGYHEPSWTFG